MNIKRIARFSITLGVIEAGLGLLLPTPWLFIIGLGQVLLGLLVL